MVEAPSVREDTNVFEPYFPLIESAMEIKTEGGRKVALEMIHSILHQELEAGLEAAERMKA
jgi:hypothetical protein